MCRHALGLLVLLLCAWSEVHAQRLPIKAYTTADGLAHNAVNRIVRDSRGFLWFCTGDGLSRFDGYSFATFDADQGLPQGSVNDFLETRSGEYWVATGEGLVRFDPKGKPESRIVYDGAATTTPMFTVVVPDDPDRRARAVNVLHEGKDGTIWIGTNKDLYRLEHANGRWSVRPIDIGLPRDFPEQRVILDVLQSADGSLWIAAPSGLYRRWPDGRAARYTERDGLPNAYLQDIFQDSRGQLWGGTRLGGFFRFSVDGDRTPIVDLGLTYPDDLPSSWVWQLFESSDRRFWVANAWGLVEFFPTASPGNRFRTYAKRNGLTESSVTALAEDLDGNLWLGTESAGAMKLTRGGFSTFGPEDGIEAVHAVFADRAGTVCFQGTVQGDARTSVFEGARLDPVKGDQPTPHSRLGCFDGRRFDWFKPASVTVPGWEHHWVKERVTLRTRSGDWWVGTAEGVYRFPPTDRFMQLKTARPLRVYALDDGLAAVQVFRLFEDSRGDVWISTTSSAMKGLARWDHISQRVRDLAGSPGLPSVKEELARSFGEDRSGAIWIGFNGGLARYTQGAFTFFTPNHGLPPGPIMDIRLDRSGRLWLASARGGLLRVDNPSAERPAFVGYTTTQGLSSNNIEVITEDAGGLLYVGGGHGLDRFDPATGQVKHFTSADGLTSGAVKDGYRDRHGALWFGMSNGLARLTPVPEKSAVPPTVLISGFRVRGQPQLVSVLGERELTLPDFAPAQNQVQIDFVALGFRAGDVLRYQYRLERADDGWSVLGLERTVTYASLAAGSYRFVVRAVNSDGLVSDHPATVTFTILRPIWQRWWALTLAALALVLTAQSLYRYRVSRLLEVANMRTRIASDLHDDIGANLTRIALLSEVARRNDAGAVAIDEGPLASIARIARESVSSMSDIVWAINPARDTVLDLTRRMRQHADEVFTLRGIELRFSAPAVKDVKLGVDVRRDLLLIFKEAVNNAARHSRCSRVDIDLRVEAPRLVLTVVDNGVGFDSSAESQGQGLSNMKRRALKLAGSLVITSGVGSGTTLRLDIRA